MLTVLALALANELPFPKDAKELEGLYVIRTGFEIRTIKLGPNGAMKMTQEFDHPGLTTWTGTWSYVNQSIAVALNYTHGGEAKVMNCFWVPLAWGDRLMLVDEDEVRSGEVLKSLVDNMKRLNLLGKRDDKEMSFTDCAVRVNTKNDQLPHRYGKIFAPKEFETTFAGIELKLPK